MSKIRWIEAGEDLPRSRTRSSERLVKSPRIGLATVTGKTPFYAGIPPASASTYSATASSPSTEEYIGVEISRQVGVRYPVDIFFDIYLMAWYSAFMTKFKPLLVRFYPDERKNLKREARRRKVGEVDLLREFAQTLSKEKNIV